MSFIIVWIVLALIGGFVASRILGRRDRSLALAAVLAIASRP